MHKFLARYTPNLGFGACLLSALVVLVLLLSAFGARAQNTTVVGPQRAASNIRHFTAMNATGGQTFATTSYADLVGTILTFNPSRSPTASGAFPTPYRTVRIRVSYSMDVSKATATTGSCAVYINGAVVSASERFSSSAAVRNTIGGSFTYALTGDGAQVVKLQCRSGDTNIFTVTNAQVSYDELY